MSCRRLLNVVLTVLITGSVLSTAPSPAGAVPTDSLSWLSTGDSYSAGEGVADPERVATLNGQFVYLDRKDQCAQSQQAWGPAAAALVKDRWDIESLIFSACTGRFTRDFYTRYDGNSSLWEWTKDQGLPAGDRFDIVTMTFGGNDVGFPNVVRDCLPLYNPLDPFNANKLPGTLTGGPWSMLLDQALDDCDVKEATLDEAVDGLAKSFDYDKGTPGGVAVTPAGSMANFYKTVLDRHVTPRGHLVVLGYPHLFAPPPTKLFDSATEWPAWNVRCSLISASGAAIMNRVGDRLNDTLRKEVEKADPSHTRIEFVPVVDSWREGGHELCGKGEDWLNGISPRRQFNASFHPNAQGYAAEAKAVAEVVRGLPLPPPACPKGTTCLGEMTADLDGDHRDDHIGLYLDGSIKRAQAVLATGRTSTLTLTEVDIPSVNRTALAAIGVLDADGDGRDEAIIRTGKGGNTFQPYGILKLDGDRLVLIGEPQSSGPDSITVDGGANKGAGFRCGPLGPDGKPRLTVNQIQHQNTDVRPDPGAWTWTTRQYRWTGAKIEFEKTETGTVIIGPVNPTSDPRAAPYYGIHCDYR